MTMSALFKTPFPPSTRTFEGSIMLSLATGNISVDEARATYTALASELDADTFAEYFPESSPVDPSAVDGIVDAVAAANRAAITQPSKDALALIGSLVDANAAGLVIEFGDAIDDDDAIALAHELRDEDDEDADDLEPVEDLEDPERPWGYVYADAQDLDELILSGELSFGYGTFGDTGRPEEDAAAELVRVMREAGLPARHDEESNAVVLQGLHFELPLDD